MLRQLLACALLPALSANGQHAQVPIIGCPADGQLGFIAPISARSKSVHLPADTAQQLAWYQGRRGPGVLAPGGWQCFTTYRSSGSTVYVTPQRLTSQDLFAADWKGIDGPAVVLSDESGGTSGRFSVAQIISLVFPAYQAFAQAVVDEGFWTNKLPHGPFQTDTLRYRNNHTVEYLTPPRHEGLGTQSRLTANDLPITGVDLLTGADTDLVSLQVRLPVSANLLAPAIIRHVEEANQTPPPHPAPQSRHSP